MVLDEGALSKIRAAHARIRGGSSRRFDLSRNHPQRGANRNAVNTRFGGTIERDHDVHFAAKRLAWAWLRRGCV